MKAARRSFLGILLASPAAALAAVPFVGRLVRPPARTVTTWDITGDAIRIAPGPPAGVRAWLSADDGLTSVGGVTAWIDRSGNGNHAVVRGRAKAPRTTGT